MYAIKVDNVSKVYRLYRRPVDRLKEAVFRKLYHDAFEALKNVSFVVEVGDTVGIIGENGAGKSTLLKILAGTIVPSAGKVEVRGKVSALLELGAGFHQEFTGRENIYLNAALQGLTKEEIEEKEESIVEFAELGAFIDRPLKTYSSGMVVRLAFSIATSVDPDILIVDEALSVGDQYFQKKSFDRMIELKEQNRSVVFCSHSMYYIMELCNRALWLHNGAIRMAGAAEQVVAEYEKWCRMKGQYAESSPESSSLVSVSKIMVRDPAGKNPDGLFYPYDDIEIELEIRSAECLPVHVGVGFREVGGINVFGVTTKAEGIAPIMVRGTKRVRVVFPRVPLIGGSYQAFGVALDDHALHVYNIKLSKPFTVVNQKNKEYGLFFLSRKWTL